MSFIKKNWHGGLPLQTDTLLKSIKEINFLSLPKIAKIGIYKRNHEGEIEVKIGDIVKEGEYLGRRGDLNVHSSVPGEVIQIQEIEVENKEFMITVFIKVKGKFDILGKEKRLFPWRNLNKDTLCYILKDKGVINFFEPEKNLFHQLMDTKGKKIKHLIINGIENSPMLYNNYFVLKDYHKEIATGISIISYILGDLKKISLAIDTYKFDLIPNIKKSFSEENLKVKIKILKNKYPQSNSNILFNSFSDEKLKGNESVLDKKYFIIDVYTLLYIYEAIELQKPVMEKIITINGDSLFSSFIIKVKIGTLLSNILQDFGGLKKRPKKIVIGGLFSKNSTRNIDIPIDKNMDAILLLSDSYPEKTEESECIDCNECIRICPVSLNPIRLYDLIKEKREGILIRENINLCISCGLCSYVCPSNIPLRELIDHENEKRKLKSLNKRVLRQILLK